MECHTTGETTLPLNGQNIALVGQPNVGKSVIFQRLTGQRVVVSNYPGTTVELTHGVSSLLPGMVIVDTPGVVTLPSSSEDEQVTERVLFEEPLKAIIQVGDAKNLRRTLLLTTQLAELGKPLLLTLNMMDEADARGVKLNPNLLSDYLNLPVIPTTAIRGEGIQELVAALEGLSPPQFRLNYPAEIEQALAEICGILPETPVAPRALALLWLSRDPVCEQWLRAHLEETTYHKLETHRHTLQLAFVEPLSAVIQQTKLQFVERVAAATVIESGTRWRGFSTLLGNLTTHPFWGLVILGGVLYALYWFVGIFGAGTLVDLLESQLFAQVINPWITQWVQRVIPYPLLADFIIGKYGLWTMGMTYALALILPIVSTFFLAFGLMEDSGYLPRLAALSNRLFASMGLNGKAVMPMVLGLGCVTMATLTTRVLESKRDRVLVTLLLALAIPCSAQLGVVMGMLAGISFSATLIWSGVVFLVLLAVGWLASHLVPGERSALFVELPPLRKPVFSNVTLKTLARLEWYLKEVVPLFLLGTALMFLLDEIGILSWMSRFGQPLVVHWLGLPPQASNAFLMGFLRRDFGAAGLFVLESQGLLSPLQVVVAMVTITLFVPCVASVFMIAKERGTRTAIAIALITFPLAFFVGGLLFRFLPMVGWG